MRAEKKIFAIMLLLGTIVLFLTGAAIPGGGNDWKAPPSADKLQNPYQGDARATEAGKKIYQNFCVSCHGKAGKGNGDAGVYLDPPPADLTSAEVQEQTNGAIYWKITNGNPPMASYKEVLNKKQRWQLVNYIRKLRK